MNAKELQVVIEKHLVNKRPLLIKGIPGAGKSDIVAQVVAKLGYDLMIEHPVISDPTDFKGLPFPSADHASAQFLIFGNLKRMQEATKPLVVFFDDLGQAPEAVQAALMQVLLLREIAGVKISDEVRFIAATNDRGHKAGVHAMLEPLKGRFGTIVELQPDLDCWIEWALAHDMPIKLIAFNKARPQLFHSWKPTADLTNSPNPRNIASVGHQMNMDYPRSLWHEVYTGAVGEAYATDLIGWIDICDDLPDIDAILLDPNNQPLPQEIGAMWAVSAALAERMSAATIDNAAMYLAKMEPEFSAVAMLGAIRRDPSLQHTRGWIEWTATNHHFMSGQN